MSSFGGRHSARRAELRSPGGSRYRSTPSPGRSGKRLESSMSPPSPIRWEALGASARSKGISTQVLTHSYREPSRGTLLDNHPLERLPLTRSTRGRGKRCHEARAKQAYSSVTQVGSSQQRSPSTTDKQSIRYFKGPERMGRQQTSPPARPDRNENGRLGTLRPLFPAQWQQTFDVSRR